MCHASCVYYYYCKLFGTMPRRLFDSTLHVSLTYTERCACLDVLQRFPAWAASRADDIQHSVLYTIAKECCKTALRMTCAVPFTP